MAGEGRHTQGGQGRYNEGGEVGGSLQSIPITTPPTTPPLHCARIDGVCVCVWVWVYVGEWVGEWVGRCEKCVCVLCVRGECVRVRSMCVRARVGVYVYV